MDRLPEIFNNISTVNNDIHHYNTKQRDNLHVEHKVKKLENLESRHQGIEIWNSIPTNIQECKTLNISKENSETLLFNHTTNCDVTKPRYHASMYN